MSSPSQLEQASKDLRVARIVMHKLGETFDSFQLHSCSILSLAEQLRNLKENFAGVDNLLVSRVKELEVKERENAEAVVRVENLFKEVELRRRRVEMEERSVSGRAMAVEMREKDVKECYEVLEMEKRDVDERRQAVAAMEARFVEELNRINTVEEREKEVERRREAAEAEKVRVRDLTAEVDRRRAVEEAEEVRVRDLKAEVERRETEVDRRREEVEAEEVRVKDLSVKVDRRRAVAEAEEVRICELRAEAEERIRVAESKKEEVRKRIEVVESKEEEISVKEKEMEEIYEAFELREKEMNEEIRVLESREKLINDDVRNGAVGLKEEEIKRRSEALEMKEKDVGEVWRGLEAKEKEISMVWGRVKIKEREVNKRGEMVGVKEKELDEMSVSLKAKEKAVNERQRVLEVDEKQMNQGFQVLELKEKEIGERHKAVELKEKQMDESVKAALEVKEGENRNHCRAMAANWKQINQCTSTRKRTNESTSGLDVPCEPMESSRGPESREKVANERSQGELLKKRRLDVPCESVESKEKQSNDSSSMKIGSLIHTLCINMDVHGVKSYLLEHVNEQSNLKDKILDALRCAFDPAKLVLDVCRCFYEMNSVRVHSDAGIGRTSCIFILERLLDLSASIIPSVKEDAGRLAVEWKSSLQNDQAEIFGFLFFVVLYKLANNFNTNELIMCFGRLLLSGTEVYRPEQTLVLCRILGLLEKIPGHVRYLIRQQKFLVAVHYVCGLKLQSSFPPVHLLEAFLELARKRVEMKHSDGTFEAKKVATNVELNSLRNVVKCVSKFKLESEFPPDPLLLRIKNLQHPHAASQSSKKQVSSASVAPFSHQGKHPRVETF